MLKLDQNSFKRIFSIQHDERSRPFWIERPPLFSSAAAYQETHNGSAIWRQWGDTFIAWQYGEWIDEAIAAHDTAFLGDWSAISKVLIRGPDATTFLQHIGVADLTKFAVGNLRHFVLTNERGRVATEGVLARFSENEYYYTAGGGEWIVYQAALGAWDVSAELVTPGFFLFELQGIRSINILERLIGRSLRHLEFNRHCEVAIRDIPVRVLRTGISGELGYEVHGSSEFGAEIWGALMEAGAEYGITPLGMRSQVLTHIEAGIATCGFDYMPSSMGTPGGSNTSVSGGGKKIRGTYQYGSVDELFRSPFELNWCSENVVRHGEFIGADALRAELDAGGPQRRLFGLVWNSEDVMSVYASLFSDAKPQPQMDMPRRYAAEYLSVVAGSTLAGCATSRVYSPKLRRMISLAVIDRDVARLGEPLTVLWGDSMEEAVEIRAELVQLPFKRDNRRIDVTTLPET